MIGCPCSHPAENHTFTSYLDNGVVILLVSCHIHTDPTDPQYCKFQINGKTAATTFFANNGSSLIG